MKELVRPARFGRAAYGFEFFSECSDTIIPSTYKLQVVRITPLFAAYTQPFTTFCQPIQKCGYIDEKTISLISVSLAILKTDSNIMILRFSSSKISHDPLMAEPSRSAILACASRIPCFTG